MKLLPLSFQTPEENLAFEEWYFQKFEEETLRIWVNPESVIVGKHQNAFSESNQVYCKEHNIQIIRRISGGGTVYHDSGNLNFSFFRKLDHVHQIEYDNNLDVIKTALQKLGYDVKTSLRHDLYLNEKKISGNAQHISKGKSLHHGTILYDANEVHLRKSIKRENGSFIDNSVKSVRSSVENLRNIRDLGPTQKFSELLIASLDLPQIDIIQDTNALEKLVRDKYKQWDWNFGYGPSFTFSSKLEGFPFGFEVDRGGLIRSITANSHTQLKQKFVNQLFDFEEISRLIDAEYDSKMASKIIEALFA